MKQAAQHRDVVSAAERECPRERGSGHRSGGHHERVERDPSPAAGHGDPAAGFDVGKRVADELAPALLREYLREVVDARLRPVEGLGDGHGAVDELAGRRDHGDVHEMAGERAHRQQRL